jgi:DnaK suppressor protein
MKAHPFTSEFLEAMRFHLVELRGELLNQSLRLQQDLRERDNFSSDEAEQSSQMSQEYQLYITQKRIRQLLLEVDSALARLESGNFGFCEETGEPIEIERLLLMPYTRLSAEGAEIRDTAQKRLLG